MFCLTKWKNFLVSIQICRCGSAWAGLRHFRLADISQLRWSVVLLRWCPIKQKLKENLKYQIDKPYLLLLVQNWNELPIGVCFPNLNEWQYSCFEQQSRLNLMLLLTPRFFVCISFYLCNIYITESTDSVTYLSDPNVSTKSGVILLHLCNMKSQVEHFMKKTNSILKSSK